MMGSQPNDRTLSMARSRSASLRSGPAGATSATRAPSLRSGGRRARETRGWSCVKSLLGTCVAAPTSASGATDPSVAHGGRSQNMQEGSGMADQDKNRGSGYGGEDL